MATRAGSYPHSLIKDRRRSFLEKHWLLVAMVAISFAVVIAAIAFAFPHWYVPGWAAILGVVGFTGFFVWSQVDGTYQLVMGRDAERWTSKGLRKKLGSGWHVVDGLVFWHGDADHIVVGPTGVYVVEVKNTDCRLNLESRYALERVGEWANAVNRRARSTRLLLNDHSVTVESVVVIWGSEVTGRPQMYNGVPVMRRRDLAPELQTWRDRPMVLSPAQVDSIRDDLVAQRSRQTR